jgi:hypothetical protein
MGMGDELHEPDLRGPAIIVTGSVISGFKFHGPFETIDDAARWYETKTISGLLGIGCCTIVLIEKPEEQVTSDD